MQARLFALTISGKRELPSKTAMNRKIEMFKKFQEDESGPYIAQWFLYVNWIQFMDMCAREIGCIPRWSWLITYPSMFFKLLLCSMNTFQYRLRGPGAKPKLAKDVINRLPYTEVRENFFFASIHYTMSLYQWPLDALYLVTDTVGSMFANDKKMD